MMVNKIKLKAIISADNINHSKYSVQLKNSQSDINAHRIVWRLKSSTM